MSAPVDSNNEPHSAPGRPGDHGALPLDPDVVPVGADVTAARLHRIVAAVALGGIVGAPARYELGVAFPAGSGAFPATTFAINLSGALVLGALLTLIFERWPPTTYVRPFVGTGFVGAYTTWSTFAVEADLLAQNHHLALAVLYCLASLVGGLFAVAGGMAAARRWPVRTAR